MAYQSPDDGFREIQLNGKQLVFLFMAATVVSVVIFLCGVLVGRGARPAPVDSATTNSAESVVTEIPVETPASTAPATTQPEVAEPPPTPTDELTYYERLEKDKPPAEKLKPADTRSQKPAPPPPAPAVTRATPPTSAPPATSAAERAARYREDDERTVGHTNGTVRALLESPHRLDFMRSYLDFEKPVAELEAKVEELRALGQSGDAVSIGDEITRLETKAARALDLAWTPAAAR